MLNNEEIRNLDLNKLKKVHFVGIISGFNSFCANFLLEKGITVTASEIVQDSPLAKEWIERGVLYQGGHNSEYITEDIDLVVYPNGPIPGNPECEQAQRLNVPTITIAQLTGLVGRDFKVIAVAGTHGKTTTSALVTWLIHSSLGTPNFIIGDTILGLNRSWNYNPNSEYLVIEACEYKRQFLDRAPTPYISVITNIDLDHTDYYKNQEDYNSAFVQFLTNTTGCIVIDSSGMNESKVIKEVREKNREVVIIDMDNAKERYRDIEVPNLFGLHNRENLYRACGVGEALNIELSFKQFPGVASRFEYLGDTNNGMKVFLDYAHNPKKIEACLMGAKSQFPDKKIVLVWQPHSFERSYTFKKDFAMSLFNADIVYIPNIYSPTRETEVERSLITQEDFVNYLASNNPNIDIRYTKDFQNSAEMLKNGIFNEEYICILASAGDLKNITKFIELKKD
jgi:UDP-N-acetylmuramate--alanine ligase